jgi:hypothetical protein
MRAVLQEVYDILSTYRKTRDQFIPDSQTIISDGKVHVPLHLIDQGEQSFQKLGQLIREWQSTWQTFPELRNVNPTLSGSMDFELNTLLPIFQNRNISRRRHRSSLEALVQALEGTAEENLEFLKRAISETGLECIRAARENMPNALFQLGCRYPRAIERYGYEALKQSILHSNPKCVRVLKQEFGVSTEILIVEPAGVFLESAIEYLHPANRRFALSPAVEKEIIMLLKE